MRLASILPFAFAILASTAVADDAKAPDAKAELQAAIDILKAHHMNSAKMDWPTIETHANAMIANAKTAEDAYPAIRYLVQQTLEKHTSFNPADSVKATASDEQVGTARAPDIITPEGYVLAGQIGLVTVGNQLGSVADDTAYARAAQSALTRFAQLHICRIIVDLRVNYGGNMYPMINGVVALLGKPPYGYWQQTGDASDMAWTGTNGQFTSGHDEPSDAHARSSLTAAPVAILIDRDTVSAGEFTAMAFEDRANTRFFGEPSAGYVTTNQLHPLPDGAELVVSQGWATDRLHREYRQRIVPDEETARGQATLDAAIAWLKHQSCRG